MKLRHSVLLSHNQLRLGTMLIAILMINRHIEKCRHSCFTARVHSFLNRKPPCAPRDFMRRDLGTGSERKVRSHDSGREPGQWVIRQTIPPRYWLSGQLPGLGASLPSQSVRIAGGSLGHKKLQGHVLLQP